MTALIDREILLNVGGIEIRSRPFEDPNAPLLKVGFQTEMTSKREPNKSEIKIYNLNESNRTRFQEKGIPVILVAGYRSATSNLFNGALDFGSNTHDGLDWITTLQSGDAGRNNYRTARVNISLNGPVDATEVARQAAAALGINVGNLEEKLASGSLRETFTQFSNGVSLSGKAEKEFSKVIKSLGYSWSIQGGQLQILGPKDFIGTTPQLISNGTGMIGSPQPGEKGFVNVRSLIQPNLLPGNRIQIESKTTNGFFRIENATFTGDTWGQDWYADLEVKPL